MDDLERHDLEVGAPDIVEGALLPKNALKTIAVRAQNRRRPVLLDRLQGEGLRVVPLMSSGKSCGKFRMLKSSSSESKKGHRARLVRAELAVAPREHADAEQEQIRAVAREKPAGAAPRVVPPKSRT